LQPLYKNINKWVKILTKRTTMDLIWYNHIFIIMYLTSTLILKIILLYNLIIDIKNNKSINTA
jgi:hypothetical protein